jgi:hypothetical protein
VAGVMIARRAKACPGRDRGAWEAGALTSWGLSGPFPTAQELAEGWLARGERQLSCSRVHD